MGFHGFDMLLMDFHPFLDFEVVLALRCVPDRRHQLPMGEPLPTASSGAVPLLRGSEILPQRCAGGLLLWPRREGL